MLTPLSPTCTALPRAAPPQGYRAPAPFQRSHSGSRTDKGRSPAHRLRMDGGTPGPAGRAAAVCKGRDGGAGARGRAAADPTVPPRWRPATQLQAPASSGRAAPSQLQGAGRPATGSPLRARPAPALSSLAFSLSEAPAERPAASPGAAAARRPPPGRKWRPAPSLPR